jgi:hypothetical protein
MKKPRSRKAQLSTWVYIALTVVSVPACGSSAPPAKVAQTETTQLPESTDSSDQEATPAGPDCGDGTCFKCGQALCLQGFYCDESSSVSTCQWLAKCGKAASCSCIQQTLGAGCTCGERKGGTFVKCS